MMIFSQGDLETCYSKVGRRLPIEKQDGGTEYVVLSQHLNISRSMLHNISVIAYGAFKAYSQAYSCVFCQMQNLANEFKTVAL